MDQYLTPAQAAAELGMSRSQIKARLAAGVMTGIRAGARGWSIPRAEVERWQRLGKQKPGPKPRHARPLRTNPDD